MVITVAPQPIKHINAIFAKVDAVALGRRKQEAEIREEKLVEI